MTRHVLPIVAASILLTGGSAMFGQATSPTPANPSGRTAAARTDADVTYGRIKELTAGQKVVIDVDNAVDKSFDLTDKDTTVKLAKGLKEGDPVQVTERDRNGKKTVQITRHSGGGVTHGDKSRTGETARPEKK
jgi:hypothetical protein